MLDFLALKNGVPGFPFSGFPLPLVCTLFPLIFISGTLVLVRRLCYLNDNEVHLEVLRYLSASHPPPTSEYIISSVFVCDFVFLFRKW